MKIFIIGTRGIPARYGGFETFAEEISMILIKHGYELIVQCDQNSYQYPDFKGIKLYFSRTVKTGNQLKYYYEGIKWGIKNSDILLVTGTGGAVFYFLNIFERKIIITNPDGLDYKRAKWPWYAKIYLRLSETLAYFLSDYLIADSKAIGKYLEKKYKFCSNKINVIEYGAHNNNVLSIGTLEKYFLFHKDYYLIVCRLEPENNIHIILEAFIKASVVRPLIIVGEVLKSHYVNALKERYKSDRIRFLGGIYNKEELAAIRYSCRAYFHGHSVGGTNPSLLEAMACANPILCHDNEFNREVTDGKQLYFKSVEDCILRITELEGMDNTTIKKYGEMAKESFERKYTWGKIGDKYLSLLNKICEEKSFKRY